MSLLEARGLTRDFGGLRAVDRVDFALEAGEVRALIGPNGAGKTTFVGMLTGRVAPSAGTVRFDGRDVTRLPAHARARLGMAYAFQITSVFCGLTAWENVALAARPRGGDPEAALAQVGLLDRAEAVAGALSYGHQRLLEVAMGLAQNPRLMILDEPTQGLAAGEIAGFEALVRGLRGRVTVLLIEHNVGVVMALADRVTVLNFGAKLAEGSPAAIRADPAVQAAYLGA